MEDLFCVINNINNQNSDTKAAKWNSAKICAVIQLSPALKEQFTENVTTQSSSPPPEDIKSGEVS